MRGENKNISTTVLTEVRTTVKKKKFSDVATFVLLWHDLLFSVYECFHKLHKKCQLIGLKQLFCLLTSLSVRKSNFHWFKHFLRLYISLHEMHAISFRNILLFGLAASYTAAHHSTSIGKKTIFAQKHLTIHTS